MKKITTLILMVFTLVFASACSCGKSSEPTTSDYSAAFGNLATNIHSITAKPTANTLSYIDSSQSKDENYHSVGAFAIFLRESFKSENFSVIGEGVVYFTSTAKVIMGGQEGEMPMNGYLKIEYSDGKIKTDMYRFSENEGESHMVIDMEYDFSKKELKSYDLYNYYSIGEDSKAVQHYKSDGSKISILEQTKDSDYEAAITFVNTRLNGIKGSLEGAKNIGDYSKEYTIAMVEQANIVYGEGTAKAATE